MVRQGMPGLLQADVSCSEFVFGAPTLDEEVEKKRNKPKRPVKSPLTAVLESWLLSFLLCKFF